MQLFTEERACIIKAVGEDVVDIQHVGSTAIPNICAKPLIDIAIGAIEYSNADCWENAMATIGYDYPDDIGIPNHRIYGRDKDTRRFLIHVVTYQSQRWNSLIEFRDQLLSSAEIALEYEKAKISAIAKYPTVRSDDTNEKSKFIEAVLLGCGFNGNDSK